MQADNTRLEATVDKEAKHTTGSRGSGRGSVHKAAPPGFPGQGRPGEGEGGRQGHNPHPLPLLTSWPAGPWEAGLEIPEEKEDIPQHLKQKPRAPLHGVGSPCPIAWRTDQSDGTEVPESSQGLRTGCLQHTDRTLWKTFPMRLTAQAPFASPLLTPAVRRA